MAAPMYSNPTTCPASLMALASLYMLPGRPPRWITDPLLHSVAAFVVRIAPALGAGCGLLNQLLKCLFARNREDHLAHDAVGLIERGACDVEEDADLAANLNRISEQFLDDALLGLDCDPVRKAP